MQLAWIDLINIIVIFQLFVFIFFLLHKRRSLSNRLLSLFFLAQAMGISNYLINRLHDNLYAGCPHLFHVGLPFIYIWAPALYLYVRSTAYLDFSLRYRHILHFVPFFLLLGYLTIRFHLHNTDVKRILLDSQQVINPHKYKILASMMHMQVITYNLAGLFTLASYRAQLKEQYSSIDRYNLSWLSFILYGYIIVSSISLMSFIARQYLGVTAQPWTFLVYFSFFVFFNIIFYKAWSNPEIFTEIREKVKYQKSKLSRSEAEKYFNRVKSHMKARKAFLNPDLTVKDLADELAIPARYVSQIINQFARQNFYDFVNSYRIEEAKRLFTDTSRGRKTVLEILYQVGFNTKSAFNAAFKKHTGMTPTHYRKSN